MVLETFQAGDLRAWTQLTFDLSLEPASTHYDPFQYKIIAMPGWITADEATRQQIVIAAQKYLIEAQPQVSKWLGKNTYRHLAVWAKWAPSSSQFPRKPVRKMASSTKR
jgi:hypothetical protein